MNIEVGRLIIITEKLLQHLSDCGVQKVSVPMEHYWQVPKDSMYDSYEYPKEFTFGQLSETWEELNKIEDADREPIAYDLVGLAAILRAIGETVDR